MIEFFLYLAAMIGVMYLLGITPQSHPITSLILCGWYVGFFGWVRRREGG